VVRPPVLVRPKPSIVVCGFEIVLETNKPDRDVRYAPQHLEHSVAMPGVAIAKLLDDAIASLREASHDFGFGTKVTSDRLVENLGARLCLNPMGEPRFTRATQAKNESDRRHAKSRRN
jgi:hypothetical protein